MRVAWFDTEEWEKNYLKTKNLDFEVDFYSEPLNEDNIEKAEDYDAITVFVSSDINGEVLDKLDIDFISCRSTGYDHVDLESASRNNIAVANVPNYGGTTVAEHTFGLILSLSRKIYEAVRKVEKGDFTHKGIRGFDLKGKKLGVIGTGDIGKNVIRIANGFDMDIIASDPKPDKEAARNLGYMYVSQEDLLKKADIITLHTPLNEKTRHMLTGEEFKKMEETILINTARGELVKTEDLLEALEKGNVKAAGLDVLEQEGFMGDDIEYLSDLEEKYDPKIILEDHILMDRDDVLITPHNAFNSKEALRRIEDTTIKNLEKKKNILNQV